MAKIDLGSVVGPVGPQGPKPIKGTDYYTEEEKQQFTTETVGLVTTEGTKQTKSVTDEGTKQVQLITEKISEITSTGDLKLNAITTEGKNKLEAVTNEGNRVLSEIGKILETSPEGGNALQLGGKTRSEFDKEIQGVAGGYAGKFPLDSAVLDGIYLLPDTGKFYVCTKAFKDKSLIVPDSNFEELSVYKNRDKLSNLIECFETYDSASAACLGGEPYKTIQIKGKTKYIGFTKDLDTPKASMIHYKIDGEEYALRRYKGKTNYDSYMPKTYPDTYKTMTECPELPDTSDATSVWCFFKSCNKMEYPPAIDTRNCQSVSQAYNGLWSAKELPFIKTGRCTDFSYLYNCYGSPFFDNKRKFPFLETGNGTNFTEMYSYNNVKDTEFPAIDTSNGTIFIGMYRSCKSTQEFPQLNTSKGKDFRYMYEYCEKAIKVSDIDLSSISAEDITTNKKLERMLYRCDALPSVTFNNVPVGITLEQMRTTTSAPSTCEIILNHRSE